jgi:hypothetical protein
MRRVIYDRWHLGVALRGGAPSAVSAAILARWSPPQTLAGQSGAVSVFAMQAGEGGRERSMERRGMERGRIKGVEAGEERTAGKGGGDERKET